MVTTVYGSLASALARIAALKKAGIWPAYYRVPGGWSLSYDPPVAAAELDSHGYLTLSTDTMTDG